MGPLVTYRSSYSIRVGALNGELSPIQVKSLVTALDKFVDAWARNSVPLKAPRVRGALCLLVCVCG